MGGLTRVGGIVLSAVVLGIFPVLTVGSDTQSAETVFEARCSTCHATSRPLGENKTADEWRETVIRMQQHAAGQISDEERDIIIQYLSEIRGE
jgi:mono/diheme cytochrome c family protein